MCALELNYLCIWRDRFIWSVLYIESAPWNYFSSLQPTSFGAYSRLFSTSISNSSQFNILSKWLFGLLLLLPINYRNLKLWLARRLLNNWSLRYSLRSCRAGLHERANQRQIWKDGTVETSLTRWKQLNYRHRIRIRIWRNSLTFWSKRFLESILRRNFWDTFIPYWQIYTSCVNGQIDRKQLHRILQTTLFFKHLS